MRCWQIFLYYIKAFCCQSTAWNYIYYATKTRLVLNLEMLSRYREMWRRAGAYWKAKTISSEYIVRMRAEAFCWCTSKSCRWMRFAASNSGTRDMRTSFCYYAESYFVLFLPSLLWLVITLWNVLYATFKLKFSFHTPLVQCTIQLGVYRFSNSLQLDATWPNWEKIVFF